MFVRSAMAALLVLGCAATGTLAQTTRPATESKDVTAVRDAVKGFLLGLARGNSVEAHRHATSDEVTNTMIDAVIPLIKAASKMDDAAVKAFGPDGGVFGRQTNPLQALNQYARRVDDGEVQIKGLYAVLLPTVPQTQPADENQPRRQNNNNGLYLKRESDAWRVDLSEMPNAQQMLQFAPMIHFVTEAMTTAADEIRAGEYETPQEVQQALRQKIMEGFVRAQQGQ
jgi:hypothetical protein